MRKADAFGAQCMQPQVFADIVFDRPASEDCLYLNLWTPATDAAARLPVMVWIHGGGYQAGASHEPRHDGVRLARNGVVLITINYRLGVFGFLAHPALSKDDLRGSSGNYALLDMVAALQWVRDNVAAFGGDPGNVTIFGESAGSFAVNALMVVPQARGLFHKVIGESGAHFGPSLSAATREASEANGEKFGASIEATTAEALRAKPAADVLAAASKWQPWFSPAIDGVVLTEPVAATFAAGKQAQVPLLAGWNADEARGGVLLAAERPTATIVREPDPQAVRARGRCPAEGVPGRQRRRGTRIGGSAGAATSSSATAPGSGSRRIVPPAVHPSTATCSRARFQSHPARSAMDAPSPPRTSAHGMPAKSSTSSARWTRSRT